ncbi:glucosidase [Chloroflexi bacterium TSY]|nr:glucosidase [Chloroflexi bacterium TSY]
MTTTAEHQRLLAHRERKANWKNWGPYLSERAWGTVREDYSAHGTAWEYFPHDHARSRVYRWNEDGLAGICDRNQYLCFSIALWNGNDPILKERLFGLTGNEGNHGEDVKEYYFYLDSTPTHSYMKMLYKYPQAAYPYTELIQENARRGFHDFEYELLDTGVFEQDRYFDVLIEYAKAEQNDILIQITVTNRGAEAAPCHILPQLWFRNTWSWGYPAGPMLDIDGKPELFAIDGPHDRATVQIEHPTAGHYFLYADGLDRDSEGALLFTENETNLERLFRASNASPFVKDAFHRAIVDGISSAVNPAQRGTKMAAHYHHTIDANQSVVLKLRLSNSAQSEPFGTTFTSTFRQRQDEADAFYAAVQNPDLNDDERRIQRQALAGMLWSKQLFYYDIEQWLQGDPALPSLSAGRKQGRNRDWDHLHNFDVISMPDKWEYPWYATWDLAFHCLPLALIDADFAKRQMVLFTREWYMHPNGALPAYEWAFGDVNPPVHAWATWRLYKIDARQSGKPDRGFLESVFHKLMLNFTWWVNRKDEDGNNIFQGGFLGLDNISVFDRSAMLPTGGHIDQADGTSWLGFYSLMMMRMALELAAESPIYQDVATKFFEHFLRIATAMNNRGGHGHSLWDPQDQFFYDALHLSDGTLIPLRVRSLVGLMPLIAIETIDDELLDAMPDFRRRSKWFLQYRPHLAGNFIYREEPGVVNRHAASLLTKERLIAILRYMLDENEFLSEYGIRSISKFHEANPYRITLAGETFEVGYQPAESQNGLFGGNSNWRGPIWFPINYLIIEGLQRFHHYYGDELKVECPTGSGNMATLEEVACDLSQRLIKLFLRNSEGKRPIYGGLDPFQNDPHWRDHLLFYEYFHGDNGAGLGASHQTGWTGLVAKLLQQSGGLDE